MPERKCIDPAIVESSDGRAPCPVQFNVYRNRDCEGCPKRSNFVIGNPRSESEKLDNKIHLDRYREILRQNARKTGNYDWI